MGQSQDQGPEEIGIAFDALAGVEDQAVALEQVARAFDLTGGEAQKVSVTVLVFLTALARAAGR